MRSSGLALSLHKFHLDKFFSGININQDVMPWWADAIINWLQIAERLLSAHGKLSSYMLRAEDMIDKNPAGLYKLYKQYSDRLRNDVLSTKR